MVLNVLPLVLVIVVVVIFVPFSSLHHFGGYLLRLFLVDIVGCNRIIWNPVYFFGFKVRLLAG
jgi:hypothetical protein